MHHTSPQYSHIYDDYQRQGNCDHSDIVHQQGIELDGKYIIAHVIYCFQMWKFF